MIQFKPVLNLFEPDVDLDGGFGHDEDRRPHRTGFGPGSTGFLQTITDSLEDEDEDERRAGGIAEHRARHGQRHPMRMVEKPQLISPDLTSNFMMAGGDRCISISLKVI